MNRDLRDELRARAEEMATRDPVMVQVALRAGTQHLRRRLRGVQAAVVAAVVVPVLLIAVMAAVGTARVDVPAPAVTSSSSRVEPTAGVTTTPTTALPTKLEVDRPEVDAGPGERLAFTASAVYENGDRENVTELAEWTLDNPDVAQEVDKGVVVVTEAGTATYTATFAGEEASARITVPQGLLVTPQREVLGPGQRLQLKATAIYTDDSTREITDEVDWIDSPEDVVTVNFGLVQVLPDGSGAAVTITARLGALEDSAVLEVSVRPTHP